MASAHTRLALAAASLALLLSPLATPAARASDDPALDQAVHRIAVEWAQAKYGMPEGSQQSDRMNVIGDEADALAAQYPDRAEALIWDGIITSERASMANPLFALGLAKKARDVLQKAEAIDPAALDAGAPTSLGVLYYRVPGFPIGFGDNKKARQLLEQAVTLAPNGLDAWYFYGDFLHAQGQDAEAIAALQHALAVPQDPDRPLWDKSRRIVVQQLIDRIGASS